MASEEAFYKVLKAAGLDSVRFARGVVGNSTFIFFGCVGFAAVAAWALRAAPGLALAGMGLFISYGVFALVGIWRFADKHPDLALLGGAELLKLRQMEMGAKEMPTLPNSDNVAAPMQDQVSEKPDA